MRATRSVIGYGLMRGSHAVPVVNDVQHLLRRTRFPLFKPLHLHSLVFVLEDLEFLLAVEEVHDFSTVDLEETHLEAAALRGERVKLLHSQLGDLRHRECLAGASLTVGEASHHSVAEERREKSLDLELVDIVGALAVGEDIIELEICVFNVLGDAIHAELTLVHDHLGVRGRYAVNLATLHVLFLKKRPLADADAQTHL